MKNFSQFIYETGTGSGTYSGAAAQQAGEKKADELRKKLQSVRLKGRSGERPKTKTKTVYVTPKDKKKPENKSTPQKALPPAKPESKKPKQVSTPKPESKKPKQVSTPKPESKKPKALPPAKPESKNSVKKKSVNTIRSLAKSSAKTKAISSKPQRQALPPAKKSSSAIVLKKPKQNKPVDQTIKKVNVSVIDKEKLSGTPERKALPPKK